MLSTASLVHVDMPVIFSDKFLRKGLVNYVSISKARGFYGRSRKWLAE